MKGSSFLKKTMAICVLLYCSFSFAQVTYSDAGYLSVVDFGATPDNPTDDDQYAINACIEAAIDQNRGVFLPAGDYHVSEGVVLENDRMECSQFMVITGSTKDALKRTRIILKEGSGTHTVIEGMEFGLNGGSCYGNTGWTDTYHRVLKHIDIKIESQNNGSVAVRWRGAEGCGIYDVHVNLTDEPTAIGFQNLPGSGGSTHTISVIGGRIAIDMYSYGDFWEGAQPSPTVSGGYFEGQSEHAIAGEWRGMLNLVGCHFKMNNNVIVVKDLRRMGAGGYGGSVALVDCIIDYESTDGNNTAITPMKYKIANGFTLTNCYLNNVDYLTTDKAANNPDGWVYYEEVAYDDPSNLNQGGEDIFQGVFIDKSLQIIEDIWIKNHIIDVVPPVNLCTKHKIPLPFPGFEWDGAVCIDDFSGSVEDGDWAPAFNEALNSARIVVVPPGEYMVKSTIHLKSNSCLIGLSHERSDIYSAGNRNFDSSTDPYSDPRPIIDTPDDADATCIISDIAINTGIPVNGNVHTPGAVGGYPLLWRAGRNSVIKHIDTRYHSLNNFRDHYTLSKTNSFDDINLSQTNSPVNEGGMRFKTYNITGVWNTDAVFSSAFLLETHDNDQRIVTRPFDNIFDPVEYNLPYATPNLTITTENSGVFDLTSLSIGTADFNTTEDTIFIIGYTGNSAFDTIKLVTNGQNPRPQMASVSINWTDLDSVLIIADNAFYLDNVESSTGSANFNLISGTDIQYDARITQSMLQHLNINPEVHDKVLITGNGGGKWYNHQLHGKQWLNFNCGFIRIQDTKGNEPLHFYHLHAQHGHQRARVYMDNASHVSVYGTKVEIPTSFMRITNSDNIRIFGHGGLTNPVPGHNYYYFENTTNYLLAGLADQTYTSNTYPGDEFNELVRVNILEGEYNSLADVTNGVYTDPGYNYKPILWCVGTPATGADIGCSNYRTLTVINGSKTWQYCVGEEVTITADTTECMIFSEWTGYTTSEQDTLKFIMPDQDITMTASFIAKPNHLITINNGYGSGTYCEGSSIRIYAGEAPVGMEFDKWIGNGVSFLANDTLPNTELTVPNSDVEVTAQFKEAAIIPAVSIASPVEGDIFQYNESILIEVSATIPSGSIVKVELYHEETLIGTVNDAPFNLSWQYTPDTVSQVKLVAKAFGDNGTSSLSDTLVFTVNSSLSPFLDVPHTIPGRIEAEHFDFGGFGNAYWDADLFNYWDDYRVNESVDIQQTLDSEGIYNIGYIENDEYLKYSVDIDTTGYYSINFRIASNGGGGKLFISMDDEVVTGTININSTGGWQEWSDLKISEVLLNKGLQTMKLSILNSGFNLNYYDFAFDSGYVEPVTAIDLINDIEQKIKFDAYPTPVKDELILKTFNNYSGLIADYKLYNLQGVLVSQGQIRSELEYINISNLNTGLYILKISYQSMPLGEIKIIK